MVDSMLNEESRVLFESRFEEIEVFMLVVLPLHHFFWLVFFS